MMMTCHTLVKHDYDRQWVIIYAYLTRKLSISKKIVLFEFVLPKIPHIPFSSPFWSCLTSEWQCVIIFALLMRTLSIFKIDVMFDFLTQKYPLYQFPGDFGYVWQANDIMWSPCHFLSIINEHFVWWKHECHKWNVRLKIS